MKPGSRSDMSDRAIGGDPAGGSSQAGSAGQPGRPGRAGRALITGLQGFTGRYLAAELIAAGYEVYGVVHMHDSAPVPGVVADHACDLRDPAGLARLVDTIQPDVVAHLAAIAFVGHGDVDAMYGTNLIGTRNLLEALSKAARPLRAVLLASSANVYGNATEGTLTETAPAAPANDYAVSKLAMEYMARLYADKLPITVVRPFNYTGVGQSPQFLLPKIVGHVRDRAPVIELGNLDVARDFTDVRTVVRYYRALLETPSALGETFNVCSGEAYTLDAILTMAREISGHDFAVRVNPAFVRQNEIKKLIGSCARLKATVGALPVIPLADTLRWMLDAPA